MSKTSDAVLLKYFSDGTRRNFIEHFESIPQMRDDNAIANDERDVQFLACRAFFHAAVQMLEDTIIAAHNHGNYETHHFFVSGSERNCKISLEVQREELL